MGFHRGPKIVTDGLVLYLDAANPKSYPVSGTTWKDLSGNSNNGTLINGPTFDSENNGSIVFDGVDDQCDFTFQYSLNYTVNFWIQFTGLINFDRAIIDMGSGISNSVRIYIQNNKLKIQHDIPFASTGVFSVEELTINEWIKYTVVGQSNICSIYKNGTLDNTGDVLNPPNTLENLIGIANHPTGNPSSILNLQCNISNITIYNRALTPQEILQNYNATKSRFGL